MKLNHKSKSKKLFFPSKLKVIEPHLPFCYKNQQAQTIYNEAATQTFYSKFHAPTLNFSSSYKKIGGNRNYRPINTKYNFKTCYNNNRFYLLENNNIPSIISKKSRNKNNINKYSLSERDNNQKKLNINIINTEELINRSKLYMTQKSIKKGKKKKNSPNYKNFKFNTLISNINKNLKLTDDEIHNRYRPKIKEFYGKDDYYKFAKKAEKFIRQEELNMLYKNTKLMHIICDYIDKHFMKIKFREAIQHQRQIDALYEKKQENKLKINQNLSKNKKIKLNDFLLVKKIHCNDI